jgi:cytochrome c553
MLIDKGHRRSQGRDRVWAPLLIALTMMICTGAYPQEAPPPWAYPVNPPGTKLPADDGSLRHVPDSASAFTFTQTIDRFAAVDWHPADHPQMPEVVMHGRKPDVFACGWCHRATGIGGPENANLTGLPADYIVQQMADLKNGDRVSSVHQRGPTQTFATVVKNINDAEIAAAAAYFSSIPAQSNVKVVESDTVPKTFIPWWHLAIVPGGEREPIWQRIIEVPEDLEQFTSRDARAQVVAYVPPGSIGKGETLAATGGDGKTVACATCHGPGLRGLGPIPGIAGRYATYIFRQLYDFKHGVRKGASSSLMLPAVEKLDVDDMIALSAYAASLKP